MVVPVVVDFDPFVDLVFVSGFSQLVSEESFQAFLVCAELSKCLWVVDARPDVLFIYALVTVFSYLGILSAELATVVCEKIIVFDLDKVFHS